MNNDDTTYWTNRENLQKQIDKRISEIKELENTIIKCKTDFQQETFSHYEKCTGFKDGEIVSFHKCIKKDTYEWVDAKIKFSWTTSPYLYSNFNLYVITDDGKEYYIASPWNSSIKKK